MRLPPGPGPSLLVLGSGVLAFAMAGCPTPRSPKGPPPEYEEPAAPTWLEAGAPASGTVAEAGAPPASSLPGPDQAPPPPSAN